ncbi:uncharacterized protein LOC143694800 isoform X2 [Agelaius phoeniceus]|uniref:uncharacterized protein LOC143694800 isoform X2 n=1 Tax=Agelaius phoeniceus TaxID=39638 RepID=UPI004054BD69
MKKTENWRRVGANKETDATENFFGDIKLLLTDCLSSSQGFQREAPPGASWPFGAGLGSAKGKSQKGQEEPASGRSRWLQGQCSSFREPQLSWLAQGKVATGLPQQQNASSGKPQLHAGHNG